MPGAPHWAWTWPGTVAFGLFLPEPLLFSCMRPAPPLAGGALPRPRCCSALFLLVAWCVCFLGVTGGWSALPDPQPKKGKRLAFPIQPETQG